MHDAEQTVKREFGYGVIDKVEQTEQSGLCRTSSKKGLQDKHDWFFISIETCTGTQHWGLLPKNILLLYGQRTASNRGGRESALWYQTYTQEGRRSESTGYETATGAGRQSKNF